MTDLWSRLPVGAQDALVALALLAPGLLIGALVLRGFAPGPLVRAGLRRYAGANAAFVALVALSVALGVALGAQERAIRQGTAQAAAPFDLLVGAPGSEVMLTLAAVYLQPADVPLVPGEALVALGADPEVALAAPIAFGDSADGLPVVGTTAEFVSHLSGDLADGRAFAAHGEAVVGADVPVAIGDEIEPAHGHGAAADEDAHGDLHYMVVGQMRPTGGPWDRAIVVPVESVWKVHGLASGHAPEAGDRLGPPFDPAYTPGVPAIVVRPQELWQAYALRTRYSDGATMAVLPGAVLSGLHATLGDVRTALSLMAVVTQGLVAAAVLLGLWLLMRLFAPSLALLRSLGAPRRYLMAVVWSFGAALVGVGAALGLALGWALAAVLSGLVAQRTGVAMTARPGWPEVQAVLAFVSLALALALWPGWAASRRLGAS